MGLNRPFLCNVNSVDLGVVHIVNAGWFLFPFSIGLSRSLELLPLGFDADFSSVYFSFRPIYLRVELREPGIPQQDAISSKISDVEALEGLSVPYQATEGAVFCEGSHLVLCTVHVVHKTR
jgi:hypothetical protein